MSEVFKNLLEKVRRSGPIVVIEKRGPVGGDEEEEEKMADFSHRAFDYLKSQYGCRLSMFKRLVRDKETGKKLLAYGITADRGYSRNRGEFANMLERMGKALVNPEELIRLGAVCSELATEDLEGITKELSSGLISAANSIRGGG